MSRVVKLVSQSGPTSIHIDVRIDESSDLLLSGQDIGEAPEQIFGKDDYEYWLKVPAAEKDHLLLALLEEMYCDSASVISELKEFLENRDIQCEFYTY